MNNKPSFKQTQIDFAAHIRNPQAHARPEQIDERRMAVYRRLFINSISSLLGGSFPVLRSLYNEQDWKALVRAFYKKEHNKTPHFPEIPREFVTFLKNHSVDDNKPFIYELAHYEWLELHLSKHQLEVTQAENFNYQDLLNTIPQVSPLAKIQAYQYPVHQIKKQFQPFTPLQSPVFLLIWRDTAYNIQFAELNAFSAVLLESLMNNTTQTGEQLLLTLASQSKHPDVKQFIGFGLQAMSKWFDQAVITSTIS